ncbi:HepT-like ribonuclease domain-containing protein [Methanobacterium movens]
MEHIFDEIEFLETNFYDLELEDLMKDPVLQRACIRSLEVMGEAVKNISDDFKKEYSEIEWRKIAGLRDKLIHHYFGVDWDIVWNVIQNKIPEIKESLEKIN